MLKKLSKIAVTATLIAAVAILPSVGVLANNNSNSGYVDADQTKSMISIASTSTTEYVGGGTWIWGWDGEWLFSSYDHLQKTHRTTVENSNGMNRSEWKTMTEGAAYARIIQTITGNKCYWNTK